MGGEDRERGEGGELVAPPVLVYDADCAFCRRWVERWRALTGAAVEYLPASEAAARFPQIDPVRYQEAVKLVLPNGEVQSGAEAAFTALARGGHPGWLRLYDSIPGFAFLAERTYRFIARRRRTLGALDRRLLGDP